MHIIGTAGHVDHGKSSLVRALTGTNPDRWIEEQLRGMTLDLGFAHLRFPDGVDAGIVDVPGHERFLHNMLAGAAGMELLLLVVAANEGPRPQTLEHLAILDYLNVKRAIIVLTKSDLVDREELGFVEELVREQTRGTIAADARAIGVSAITGAGMDDLREAIHAALVALPQRAPNAPAFLPIDRVFALAGHGTIVTGTLMQGKIAVGDSLTLQPSGTVVRIRSLQVFGEKRDAIDGGARVAANIPGVDVADIVRGDVLAAPEFAASDRFRVSFTPRAEILATLRRRQPVRAYIGSAELLGTLVFATVPTTTDTLEAQLFLRRPTIAFPGETYVLRRLSPKDLLGGGTLELGDAPLVAAISDDSPDVDAVARALRETQLVARPIKEIAAVANLREQRVDEILTDLLADGRARKLAKPVAYIDGSATDAVLTRVLDALIVKHAAEPWSLGLTSLGLARLLALDETLLVRILASYVEDARLAYRAGYYATLAFTPHLSEEQRAFFDRFVALDPTQPYLPGSLEALVCEVKRTKLPGVSQALDTLVATGALVKVGDSIYRGTQVADVRGKLEAYLRKEKQITMAQFRDIVGTSRKFAVPLLEFFDATGVTVRSGDLRMLRAR